ncbi:MAG: divergent polysaccharide deacetylase family protein, partial [Spirochaetaceae bacterium]|nr:divergent polysaccharide deacetylase family protein [Spirochaetaceae bacterium]
MNKPPRRRPKKIQRIHLPRGKVLLLLSAIVALGVFLLFLTTIFAPLRVLPEDQLPSDTVAREEPRIGGNGQQELPGKKLCPPPLETPPVKKPETTEALSPTLPAEPAKPSTPSDAKKPPKAPPALPEKKQETTEALSPSSPIPAEPSAPEKILVFVIDDAGHNIRQMEPFLALPFPVSIAVLPGLEYSVTAAEKIRIAGKELLLHQPMQAQNPAFDPGPGAITRNTEIAEIGNILEKNLNEIGPVAGMNNHEGSLITADAAAMGTVLQFCRQKGIFFLDSRTTAQSAAQG